MRSIEGEMKKKAAIQLNRPPGEERRRLLHVYDCVMCGSQNLIIRTEKGEKKMLLHPKIFITIVFPSFLSFPSQSVTGLSTLFSSLASLLTRRASQGLQLHFSVTHQPFYCF